MNDLLRRLSALRSIFVRSAPALKSAAASNARPAARPFHSSKQYWEQRYASGGNSGAGSYNAFAEFKAEVLNEFSSENNVRTVIEFGCGDGNQLKVARYPRYIGFDVSGTAIARCRELFASDPSKSFRLMDEYRGETADLVLSLDVIYHLVEDDVFEDYMRKLFAASDRFVIIYASDSEDNSGVDVKHVRHRKFTRWIASNQPGWGLVRHVPNRYPYRGDHLTGSFADFFIYQVESLSDAHDAIRR